MGWTTELPTQAERDAAHPLDIRDGVIHYKLYGQDGQFVPMACPDTTENRHFVRWVRERDRYGEGESE